MSEIWDQDKDECDGRSGILSGEQRRMLPKTSERFSRSSRPSLRGEGNEIDSAPCALASIVFLSENLA
jgi:hypothetical protein